MTPKITCKCGMVHRGVIPGGFQCPSCGEVLSTATVNRKVEVKNISGVFNPWIPLHKYGPDHRNNWVPSDARRWYSQWLQTIPSYGCSCQQHWADLAAKMPPNFESAVGFFEWSWKAHNEVSTTHSNKPTITLQEAYALYW